MASCSPWLDSATWRPSSAAPTPTTWTITAPGLRAAAEQHIVAPLADVGLTKSELRTLGATLGVRIADKPAAPCLASRIPYGQEVTPDKLARIDRAETVLRELGFRECRVRHHDQLARIELPADQIPRLADPCLRAEIDAKLRALGFAYVALDLRGFRSGSLNDVILGTGLRDD